MAKSTQRTATTKEAMAHFDCSQGTISSWVRAGCPHDKQKRPTGGRPLTLFDLTELSLWVKQERRNLSKHGGGDHRSLAFKAGKTDGRRKEVTDLDVARERAKYRKELAMADKAEMEVEKLRATLISAEEVKEQNLAKIARARAVLLGGPGVLSQDTVGDPAQDEKLLSEWVHRALTELATDEDEEA